MLALGVDGLAVGSGHCPGEEKDQMGQGRGGTAHPSTLDNGLQALISHLGIQQLTDKKF